MISVPYYDKDGKPLDPIEIDPAAFGGSVRWQLLREAVLAFEVNQRVGCASTKTRGEVAGTGAKPWRQKGTGRARAGTVRSPIWRGGGVTHGPRPRLYDARMPRKKRQLAVKSALLAKLNDSEIVCIEDLAFEAPKTRQARQLMEKMGVSGKCLVGLERHDEAVYKSFRNLPGARVDEVRNFNPHLVVDGGTVILTRKALDALMGAADEEGATS